MASPRLFVAAVVAAAIVGAAAPIAQSPIRPPLGGTSERSKVHGKALETNLVSQPLRAAVERGDIPGVVALVADRDGVVYEGAFGKLDVAHGTAMPTNAIFRIASMTKPITSTAIMMLIDEGRLGLDDPVSMYLPGFDHLQVITKFNAADATYETRPAKRAMTIRHLLTHTSGIGYAFSNPIVARLLQGTQKSEWELPLLHDPGDKWTYSASTRVLGLVVEKVTGKPLDVFLQERIFQPLGMTETSFVVPAENVARVATVHQRTGGKLVEQPNAPAQRSPVRGDGGLYSTARDYAKFTQMLLNGGTLGGARILSDKSVKAMGDNQIGSIVVEEQPAADPARTRPFPIGAGHDKFGFGFQIQAREGRDPKYRSAGSLSWAGIDNTHFWIDPVRHIAAVVLMQVLPFYDDAAIRTLRDFEEVVYRQVG
jgi:CubicO group peptidase (beta-lactamase class C family)